MPAMMISRPAPKPKKTYLRVSTPPGAAAKISRWINEADATLFVFSFDMGRLQSSI
jgi:hypothetical protein